MQEAFQRSPLVMVSAHQIQQRLETDARDLKQRGRALAELRQQLEQLRDPMPDEERARIEARIAEETAGLAGLQRSYRSELAAAQELHGAEMIVQVEEMAREVAKRAGLALLVRSDGVLYAADPPGVERIDITEQVARALLEKINPTEIPELPAAP